MTWARVTLIYVALAFLSSPRMRAQTLGSILRHVTSPPIQAPIKSALVYEHIAISSCNTCITAT